MISGASKRSPDERSDIRVLVVPIPAYRFAHAGYLQEQGSLKAPRRSARSAGILMYRCSGTGLEVLLVHPGGPYWRAKDEGAWSIPKGEIDGEEDAGAVASREFAEETGVTLAGQPLEPLGEIRQRAGKRVIAFAVEGDLDVHAIRSNTFEIEWPPRSGRMQTFPEIDRAEWFDLAAARTRILEGQRPLLDRLAELVGQSGTPP